MISSNNAIYQVCHHESREGFHVCLLIKTITLKERIVNIHLMDFPIFVAAIAKKHTNNNHFHNRSKGLIVSSSFDLMIAKNDKTTF